MAGRCLHIESGVPLNEPLRVSATRSPSMTTRSCRKFWIAFASFLLAPLCTPAAGAGWTVADLERALRSQLKRPAPVEPTVTVDGDYWRIELPKTTRGKNKRQTPPAHQEMRWRYESVHQAYPDVASHLAHFPGTVAWETETPIPLDRLEINTAGICERLSSDAHHEVFVPIERDNSPGVFHIARRPKELWDRGQSWQATIDTEPLIPLIAAFAKTEEVFIKIAEGNRKNLLAMTVFVTPLTPGQRTIFNDKEATFGFHIDATQLDQMPPWRPFGGVRCYYWSNHPLTTEFVVGAAVDTQSLTRLLRGRHLPPQQKDQLMGQLTAPEIFRGKPGQLILASGTLPHRSPWVETEHVTEAPRRCHLRFWSSPKGVFPIPLEAGYRNSARAPHGF